MPNQVKRRLFYGEKEFAGSTAAVRDMLQQILKTDDKKLTLKPLACDMISTVQEGLNLSKNEQNYLETNDENVNKIANMYAIAVEEYSGIIWWARDLVCSYC